MTSQIPPKRQKRTNSYSRADLYRRAQSDPFYDPTPTDDDGVIRKENGLPLKLKLAVAGIIVTMVIVVYVAVYLLMN